MTLARQCPACGGTIASGTLCTTCLDALARDLDRLADALDQLDVQLARQARSGNQGGTARSAVRPLPFDLPASEVHDLVRSVLTGWTRDLDERGRPAPAGLTDQDLAEHLRWADWRNHPAADEFADELHWVLDQVRQCIDTPPERRYLGPCGSITVDAEGKPRECDGDVVLVGNHLPKCKACGATYFRDDRLQWIADLAEDQLVTASIAAGALSAWGQHITPDLVRLWAHRGRLLPRGHDRSGRPVYSFGECRTLALASIKPKGRMQA